MENPPHFVLTVIGWPTLYRSISIARWDELVNRGLGIFGFLCFFGF